MPVQASNADVRVEAQAGAGDGAEAPQKWAAQTDGNVVKNMLGRKYTTRARDRVALIECREIFHIGSVSDDVGVSRDACASAYAKASLR